MGGGRTCGGVRRSCARCTRAGRLLDGRRLERPRLSRPPRCDLLHAPPRAQSIKVVLSWVCGTSSGLLLRRRPWSEKELGLRDTDHAMLACCSFLDAHCCAPRDKVELLSQPTLELTWEYGSRECVRGRLLQSVLNSDLGPRTEVVLQGRALSGATRRSPQTPNPKPQTPNPKPQTGTDLPCPHRKARAHGDC